MTVQMKAIEQHFPVLSGFTCQFFLSGILELSFSFSGSRAKELILCTRE